MRASTVAVLAAAFGTVVSAINTIKIKDRHFYDSVTNEPFFVRYPYRKPNVSPFTD